MAQIYFISNENGAIKIGISNSVLGRLTTLQTASPTKLVLLGAFDGNEFEERETHHLFEHLCLEGEWFRDAPEIRTYIGQVMTVAEVMQSTVAWHIANRVPLDRAGIKLGPFAP